MAGLNLLDKKAIMKQHPDVFEEYKKELIVQLKDIASILQKHNVTWWITGGTLLGLYRDNDIIPLDYDTDIAIAAETMNEDCVMALCAHSSFTSNKIYRDNNKYLVEPNDLLNSIRNGGYVPDRNWKFKSTTSVRFGDLKMHPSVDIFPYKLLDDKRWKRVYPERMRWHLDANMLPVRKLRTKYGGFFVPNNPEEYLRLTYGDDWRTPKYEMDMHRAADYENRCPRKESGDIRIDLQSGKTKRFDFPNEFESTLITENVTIIK